MTLEQKDRQIAKLQKKYTKLLKTESGYKAYLKIDHQSFCVMDKITYKKAKWYQRQLAIALERLIQFNQK